MERNPEFRGEEPAFDEIQFIKYGTQDAVERALTLGEIDMIAEVEAATFERLGEEPNIDDASRSPSPSYTAARVQPLPGAALPGREVQPGGPGPRRCARRSPTRSTASGSTRSPPAARRSSANGILPVVLQVVLRGARAGPTRSTPSCANQILDDAGWVLSDDGVRDARTARSSRSTSTCARSRSSTIQTAKLVAEQAARDRGRVQRPGGQHRQAHRADDPQGRRQAGAGVRHVHLGLGRRPLRPELPAQPAHHRARSAGSSDSFYSNPEYDRLFEEQAGDLRRRGAQGGRSSEMVAITQEDLPYLVLTEDPNLQAYRDRPLADVEPVCPAEDGRPDLRAGHLRAGCWRSTPGEGARRRTTAAGSRPGLGAWSPRSCFGVGGWRARRAPARRRREREPLELPSDEARRDERALAGGQGRRRRC